MRSREPSDVDHGLKKQPRITRIHANQYTGSLLIYSYPQLHSRSFAAFAVPHPFFVSLRGLFLSKVNGNGDAVVAEPA